MISIIDYHPKYSLVFREMNLKWLDQFGLTESHDLKVLDDPQSTIIDTGGFIFIAVEEEIPIGTAAIMKDGPSGFELAKMTVAKEWRGRGVSKLLIEKCIATARRNGADHISLFSNSQLKEAISLYEKYGFRHQPVKDAPFLTADISMVLHLT